ncbi:MAG: OsmC family protein [Sandaracinobacteroides sp.]
MAETQVVAHVIESGASPYAVDITVSGHRMAGDEPIAFGGGNLGPAPFDLLTAALGECTAMTVRWYALQQKWPLERVEVTVTHRKGGPGAADPRQDMFTKTLRLTGPELTAEQHAKLREIAARCPVQRTLEGTPHIHTAEI